MSELLSYEKYYDQYKRESLSLKEKNRIKETINTIPRDVESVLEVGCGDGRVINCLSAKYSRIIGLDISQEALKYVDTPTIQGSIEQLPFLDRSFDIVLCCEVLEHLPYENYEKGLKEIERVARKYLLVTVPNNELLNNALIDCPYCGCLFHRYRHLRSFNLKKMNNLFPRFKLVRSKTMLTEMKVIPKFISKSAQLLKLTEPRTFPDNTVCPQCGYYTPNIKQNNSKKRNCKVVYFINKLLPTKKCGGWILALYERLESSRD